MNDEPDVPRRLRDQLLSYPNVIGHGIGRERTGGEYTGELCVIVYVAQKVPEDELDEDDVIPSEFCGSRTDVQETTAPNVDDPDEYEPRGNRDELIDPWAGGVEIGDEDNTPLGTGGTGVVEYDGRLGFVTNRHVVCDEDDDCTGANIVHPASGNKIGEVYEIGQLNPDAEDDDENVDFAFVEFDGGVDYTDRLFGIDRITNYRDPNFKERYVKTGVRTGFSSGLLDARDVTLEGDYGFEDTVTMTGLDKYITDVAPGDSGGIIGKVNETDGSFRMTGLVTLMNDEGDVHPDSPVYYTHPVSDLREKGYEPDPAQPTDDVNPDGGSGDGFFEVAATRLRHDNVEDEIEILGFVSNTGGTNDDSVTVELRDDDDNLIDDTSTTVSSGEFAAVEFRVDYNQYDGENIWLETKDDQDLLILEDEYMPIGESLIGEFSLGERELGAGTLASRGIASATTGHSSPELTTADALVTAEGVVTAAVGMAELAEAHTTSFGGEVAQAAVQTIQGSAFTQSTGGEVTTAIGSDMEATADTSVAAFGITQTASGSPVIAEPDTSVTAEGDVTSFSVDLLLADSTSRAIAGRGTPKLGTFNLGDLRLAEKTTLVTKAVGSATEGEGLRRGIGGEVTSAEATSLLADSLSRAISDGEVTTATLTPEEGIRFFASWAFDGREVQSLVEEIRTWDSLVLVFNAPRDRVRDVLREVVDESGKVDVVERIDGGFDAVDRVGGQNTIEMQPPTERKDVRSVDTYLVEDYSEEVRGAAAERYEVEIEFVPEKEKAYDNEYGTLDDAPDYDDAGGRWLFEFAFGDVRTRRVSTEVDRTPEGSFVGAEIELVLLQDEVRVLEENAGKLGATNFREVPDGEDFYEDTSDDGRNTVHISSPDDAEDTIETGDYIIEEFETVWNRGVHIVTLSITAP